VNFGPTMGVHISFPRLEQLQEWSECVLAHMALGMENMQYDMFMVDEQCSLAIAPLYKRGWLMMYRNLAGTIGSNLYCELRDGRLYMQVTSHCEFQMDNIKVHHNPEDHLDEPEVDVIDFSLFKYEVLRHPSHTTIFTLRSAEDDGDASEKSHVFMMKVHHPNYLTPWMDALRNHIRYGAVTAKEKNRELRVRLESESVFATTTDGKTERSGAGGFGAGGSGANMFRELGEDFQLDNEPEGDETPALGGSPEDPAEPVEAGL